MIATTARPRRIQTARPPASSACTAPWMNSSLPGIFRLHPLWGIARELLLGRIHLVDLAMQCAPANSELFRRGCNVAVGRGQRLQNQFAFGLVQIERTRFFPK